MTHEHPENTNKFDNKPSLYVAKDRLSTLQKLGETGLFLFDLDGTKTESSRKTLPTQKNSP